MKIIVNELDPIRFRKGYTYWRLAPSLVSDLATGKDEISRWVLDAHGIGYYDHRHMPLLGAGRIERLTGRRGMRNAPVLVMTDAMIYRTDSIVRYFDEHCRPESRLISRDEDLRAAQLDMYRWFAVELDEQVYKYMLTRLLESGSAFRPVLGGGAPLLERLICLLAFP